MMNHENVVHVYGSGTDAGVSYMDDGTDLRKLLEGRTCRWSVRSSSRPYTTASAGVRLNSNNHWVVRTQAGNGTGVQVQVGCINYGANRRMLGWSDGGPVAPKVVNANSACFLTEIRARGWGWAAFQVNQPYPPPGVWIDFSNGKAFVNGSLVQNADGSSAGGASGVCIDIPNLHSKSFNAAGPGEAVRLVYTWLVNQLICRGAAIPTNVVPRSSAA